ncbi:MarR family winged helix-turn-helix transcriptional regulator [Flexivirga lutea]
MPDAAAPAPQPRWVIGQQLRRLLQAAPAVHAELARRIGVGVTDLLALDHLTSADQPAGVGELSQLLKIRSASATVLVDRLVASGHLERGRHATDGRRTTLHATASAYDDVRDALLPLIADINTITETLSDVEAEVVLTFLTRIVAALDSFAAGPPTSD